MEILFTFKTYEILLYRINNTDMIKISRVMTDYTIKFYIYMCMCITPFHTYITNHIYIYRKSIYIYNHIICIICLAS